MKTEFESIRLHSNESYDQYLLRFENNAFELNKAGVVLGNQHDFGLHYILSLHKPKLFKSLITKVNNDKGYFNDRSMRDFVKEIKQHHRVETTIDSGISKAGSEAEISQRQSSRARNSGHFNTTPSSIPGLPSNSSFRPLGNQEASVSNDGFTEVVRSNLDLTAKQDLSPNYFRVAIESSSS